MARKTWIGSILAAVLMLASVVALAGPRATDQHLGAPNRQDEVAVRKPPVKNPIKTVTKVVGRAITTVRQVPRIVNRIEVPAGQIRPCTEGDFVVDFESIFYDTVVQSLAPLVSGQVSGQNQAAAVTATIEQLFGPLIRQAFGVSSDAAATTTQTIEESLRRLVRSQLLDLLYDEAEACPEFVERVVTTVITQLRPGTEQQETGAAASANGT